MIYRCIEIYQRYFRPQLFRGDRWLSQAKPKKINVSSSFRLNVVEIRFKLKKKIKIKAKEKTMVTSLALKM